MCRLRLPLAVDDRNVRDVNLQEIVLARPPSQLSHSLNEGHALDVPHSSSQLDYAHVWLLVGVINRDPRHALNPVLDGIGDVRHDLDRLAQIVALALALDNVLVDLARGDVVRAREGDVQVALVVPEIEVHLAAVREDEDFAVPMHMSVHVMSPLEKLSGVLLRIHGACIDIEIWVHLDGGHVLVRQHAAAERVMLQDLS